MRTQDGSASYPFEVDTFRKYCLLNGLDDIGLSLRQADKIRAFEERHLANQPWLAGQYRGLGYWLHHHYPPPFEKGGQGGFALKGCAGKIYFYGKSPPHPPFFKGGRSVTLHFDLNFFWT